MSMSCVITDDEPNAINLLETLIHQVTSWHILGKCYNALEAIESVKEYRPDFIFLDINMPDINGMELAGILPGDPKIIFTTAHSEFAVESYDFQTIDYLLKPITLLRFITCAQKVESYFNLHPVGAEKGGDPDENYFFIKSGRIFRKILLKDILYFEGEKEYVRLVTGHEELLIYRRLKDIEAQLSGPFIRVHNSYIINSIQLKKIQDNHVFIREKQIPISEKFRQKFMSLIKQRSF